DGDARPAGQREPLDRNGGRTDREVHGALVGEHVATFLSDGRDVLLVQVRGAGGGGDRPAVVDEGQDLLLLDEALGQRPVPSGVATVVGDDVLHRLAPHAARGVA